MLSHMTYWWRRRLLKKHIKTLTANSGKWTLDETMRFLIDKKFLKADLTPLICTKCGRTEFEQQVLDYIEGKVCEYLAKCKHCGSIVGHWAYGGYQI